MTFLDAIDPPKPKKLTLAAITDASAYALGALQSAEHAVSSAVEGTRNDTLNREAYALHRRFTLNDLLARDTVDERLGLAATNAGLTWSEAEATLGSAWDGAAADGAEPVPAENIQVSLPECKSDPLANMMTADQLGNEVAEPIVVHIENMLTAGYSILGGSPKVGKSWLVLDLALACAAGGLAMGTVSVEPRAVLYLALEDGKRRIRHRMQQLRHGQPRNLNILTELQEGYTGIATIKAWLARHANDAHPPMVIVDTLATIRPVMATNTSNAYDIDYEFGRQMKAAADSVPGAAILAVSHNRKGAADDFIHKISGSIGVTAACDCILALSRDRGSDTATLSITGKDLTNEDDYALVRDGALWVINGADMAEAAESARDRKQVGNLGERSAEVLAAVEERGQRGETTSAEDLAHILPADQASPYLGRLHKSGRIQRVARGRYFPAGMLYAAEPPIADHGA